MINSEKQVAQQLATGLMSALDALNQAVDVTEDSQTTVAGNAKAHETKDCMTGIADKISQVIGNTSANIQSVASEFEAVDRSIRDSFAKLLVN